MTTPSADAVIREIAALGPFFAVRVHPAGTEPPRPWQPLTRPLLEARVTGVRNRLAAQGSQRADAVETRVAASVAHLALASRLMSPALAAAVLHGSLLAPTLAELRGQSVPEGPLPLSVPDDALTACPDALPAQLADALSRRLLDGAVCELADAMAAFAVSRHILWGNTASALNGAATMVTAFRPDLAARTRTLVALLLDRPPLRGTGTVADGAFRRRSCCLVYRAAPDGRGALCGDCALSRALRRVGAPRPVTRVRPDAT